MNNIFCLLIAFDFLNLYKFDPNKGDFYNEQIRYKSISKINKNILSNVLFLQKDIKR
mgnify:FL=1